jgi:branched-chain amino acid transport system substrate-binding protein
MKLSKFMRPALMFSALAFFSAAASAQLKVGIDLSSTGPAAAIGITSKNAMLMWPKTIAGQQAEYIILDDGSDPGAAVRNIRKLITEDKVDVIVGPNITPAALAALDPVAEYQTPMITLIGSASVVEPQEGKKVWAFKMAQTDRAMADVMTRTMVNRNVKTVGFIVAAYQGSRERAFQSHRRERDRADPQADGRETGCGADCGRGHADGVAGTHADRARL